MIARSGFIRYPKVLGAELGEGVSPLLQTSTPAPDEARPPAPRGKGLLVGCVSSATPRHWHGVPGCLGFDRSQARLFSQTYLTPELVAQHGDFKVLPQSFPLIAEIVSSNDEAEEVFAKVREYLESNGQEVWLIFPDSQWVLTIAERQQKLLGAGDMAATQNVLIGFSVAVADLIA